MLPDRCIRKVLGSVALAALTSAGILATGCSTQPNEPYSESGSGRAIQASDTRQAPAPGENRVAMAFPTGNRSTSDLLVEQVSANEVRAGQPYTYQLRVTNLTDQPLSGVVLRQRIPDNFKLAEGNAAQPLGDNPGQAQINVGDLGPKQSKTVQVTGIASGSGTLDTCLNAQFNPPTLCARVPIVSPAIKAIAEGPSQADVCQDLMYRYTVTNTGTGTAHNVVLQENLPDGLQTADGQRTISLNMGDLVQGQSKNATARLRAMQPGRFNTQATVRSDAGEVQTERVATAVLAPRLAVTITGPKEDYLGQPLSYQVTVKNTGDATATGTRLRLGATPGQVQFVSAQGADGAQLASERQGGGQDLGALPPGQSRTLMVNFQPQREGAVAVNATAQANCAQAVTTYTNTNILSITAAALVVTHDPDPVPVGGNVVYHITVQNKGTATDHDVKVTATLPASEQFVRTSGGTEGRNDGQTITFAAIPELAPKQTITWQVEAKAMQPDEAKFQATMTSQSTRNPAVKIEPTKLFGGTSGTETHTNEAPDPSRANPPATSEPSQPTPQS
jgi:uncharacterized repeat protein (TIGR01451 family)